MNIITKNYESLLPFLVVEAISAQAATFNSMSVRMVDRGWAWLVCGRKLLIWKFKESKEPNHTKSRRLLSPCFELQLPQTDLVHKADLIQTFFLPQNPNTSSRAITVPAALVVSPEGAIRFWSNVASERYTESPAIDMQGQEFCTLAALSSFEYLLGTTTGSVYILTIDITANDTKNVLTCFALNAPSGLLSGFGRRVTNLFFGPTEVTDTRRPLLAVPKYSQSTIEKTGSTDRPFFVMSSSFRLRHWSRTNEGPRSSNQMIREWDLQKNIYMKLISDLGLTESDNLNFWPIDMITTKTKELLMLIVTLNTARDNAINYATCTFNPYQAGDTLTNLTVLRSHSWNYSNETDDQLLALRFLERRATSPLCFMYDKKFLFLVQVNQDIYDAIDYGNQDDSILGAGIVDNHPILFTQRDGLIYVVPVASNRSRLDGTINETSIQLEPPPHSSTSARQHSRLETTASRVEPMIVEIDMDDEVEVETSRPTNISQQRTESEHSTINNSTNQSSLNNKSTDQSRSRRKDGAEELWRGNKDFEWIQQIDAREYGLASETLAKLAQESETLKDWKDTLLALNKLAELAE